MANQKKYLIANWKMNLGIKESIQLSTAIKNGFKKSWRSAIEVVLCPSYLSLPAVSEVINKTAIKLGAQDVFWHDQGSYTGEISPIMLTEVGSEYIIIGHSERRQYLCETSKIINQKIIHCLSHSLIPIVCVGETAAEHHRGDQHQVIIKQINAAFSTVKVKKTNRVIIAYEPVWVIGSGQALAPESVEEINQLIRHLLGDIYGREIATNNFSLIYGGSVGSSNIQSFLRLDNIDGALIGNASLKSQEFLNIMELTITV